MVDDRTEQRATGCIDGAVWKFYVVPCKAWHTTDEVKIGRREVYDKVCDLDATMTVSDVTDR